MANKKESALLMEKMRHGQVVPKHKHEECMLLTWEVLSDPELHKRVSEGFKNVGQSIILHGNEDVFFCLSRGSCVLE